MSKPIFVYSLRQSCHDRHGICEVSSINDINLDLHWIDRALYANDPKAFWEDVVSQSDEATDGCECRVCNR